MNTESKQINVEVLRPTEGYWLTQKNLAENEERIFSKEVWLGKYDSADNYYEVSDEVKNEMEAELHADNE